MDQPVAPAKVGGPRFLLLAGLGIALTLALGIASHLTHSSTIPDVGLPPSNSKELNLHAYDPQVDATTAYLNDLARLDYQAAYMQLAPSVRSTEPEQQFEQDQRQAGQLGNPTVWIDSPASTRAVYLLVRPDGAGTTAQHRFHLLQEQGKWWVGKETPIPQAPAVAASLPAALHDFVEQRAGSFWAGSIELLRQEPFEGGQLLLFSYIEPHPAHSLIPQRIALLSYYVNGSGGWRFAGGGGSGLVAGMSVADVAMGLTTFGPNNEYVAYYGVVENAAARTLTFTEPNGAGHTLNIKDQKTILLPNDRNPYEPVPFDHPFKSIKATDILGNTLRTNPSLD